MTCRSKLPRVFELSDKTPTITERNVRLQNKNKDKKRKWSNPDQQCVLVTPLGPSQSR